MLTQNPLRIGAKFWPDEEAYRLGTYVKDRALFDGAHDIVFLEWAQSLRPERRAQIWLTINWHQMLSTIWPDLLVGEPPQFTAASPEQQTFLDTMVAGNRLINTIYEVGIDVSRYGNGLFNTWFKDGKVRIGTVSPEVWLPWALPYDIKDIQGHVLGWRYQAGEKFYLDTQTHFVGSVLHTVYQLDKEGGILRVVSGDAEPVSTGVDDFLLVPVHNVTTSDRYFGISDYEICEPICQEEESRLSQIKYVLDKHSDPNLKGPSSAVTTNPVTNQPEVRVGGKYFPLGIGEDVNYLTWDGQLDAAFKELDNLQSKKFQLTGISPALFGGDFGRAESGSAMKRLLTSTLRKINRLRMQFDPAVKQVISVASRLAVANGVEGAVEIGEQDVHIGWQDGLPQDLMESATAYSTLKAAGLVSEKTAVSVVLEKGGSALEEELKEIGSDAQKAADAAKAAAPATPAVNDQNAPLTDRLNAALKNG
jgi:hypothetical protein